MDRQVAKFDDMANANDDMDAVEESHELGNGRPLRVPRIVGEPTVPIKNKNNMH